MASTLKTIGQRLLASEMWIFDVGAWAYDQMTANESWLASAGSLLDHMPATAQGLRVLDLGIGPGVSAFAMGRQRPDASFVGLDVAPRMLKIAQENRAAWGWPPQRLVLLRGDAASLPLADRALDAATGHSFLYLLPDVESVLAEVSRVLVPGGYVAFMEPRHGHVDWRWLVGQWSVRLLISATLWRLYTWFLGRFSASSLRGTLEQAGFSDIATETVLGGFGIIGRARRP
jgi:ubiquinone/menaquinone biosynthesis C-methylase UbiE